MYGKSNSLLLLVAVMKSINLDCRRINNKHEYFTACRVKSQQRKSKQYGIHQSCACAHARVGRSNNQIIKFKERRKMRDAKGERNSQFVFLSDSFSVFRFFCVII